MIKKIIKWFPLSLIAFFFILSLVLINTGFGRFEQILFFPLDNGKGFNGEKRLVSRTREREDRILQTIREVMLGPSELEYKSIVPVETKVQSIIYRENVLYLDFSRHFFKEIKGFSIPFQERLKYMEKNLLFNYSYIHKVIITINGQLPLSPYFRIEQDFNNENS